MSKPTLIEFAHAKAPILGSDEIGRIVEDGIGYAAQFDTVRDQLLHKFAENIARRRPELKGFATYDRLRRKYDNDIKFADAVDLRTVKELAEVFPTLMRPQVTLNNLGDGLLHDLGAKQVQG